MSTRFVRMGCVAVILAAAGWMLIGCDRKKSPSTTNPPPDGTATKGTPPGNQLVNAPPSPEPQPVSVDAQDAPDAPRALPKTHDLRGWSKSEPVRVFPSSELDRAVPDAAQRTALVTFPLQRVARCAYRRDAASTTATVLFIEAGTPEDAFGLYSVMTAQPGVLHPDGTIRAVEQDDEATVVSGWQGNAFAQVRCTSDTGQAPAPEDADLLLASILFNVPSAEPPWLLRAIQSEKGETAKLWVVRNAAALAVSRHPILSKIDPAAMNARLGLNGQELLAVAAVKAEPGEPPNLVWLAHYSQPADAQAAWERYQMVLGPDATGLDANTLVHEPKGPYFAGSWTADQESIQHQLDKLGAVLPG